jgi:hypothetical protein
MSRVYLGQAGTRTGQLSTERQPLERLGREIVRGERRGNGAAGVVSGNGWSRSTDSLSSVGGTRVLAVDRAGTAGRRKSAESSDGNIHASSSSAAGARADGS